MFKLPFGWWPGHWGLKGKTRKIAEAEYYYSGEELERKLVEINFEADEKTKNIELLNLDRKYGHLSKEEYDYKRVELEYSDSYELTLAKLQLDKKYGKIDKNAFDKAVASLNNEPWVGVIGSEYNPGELSDGFTFELDWNDEFINMLRREGYSGAKDEDIVQQWFEDKAAEEYIGLLTEGDIDPDEDENIIPRTRTVKERIDNSRTKHS